jgi:hypothetical protein
MEWNGVDSPGSEYGPTAGFCEHGDGLPLPLPAFYPSDRLLGGPKSRGGFMNEHKLLVSFFVKILLHIALNINSVIVF